MKCKKCGGEMKVETIAEIKDNSLSGCLWFILVLLSCGIALLFAPAFFKAKSTTKTYFVCQKCGRKVERNWGNADYKEL